MNKLSSVSAITLAFAISAQAATVGTTVFNPTRQEKVAAAGRPMPKSDAQKTAEEARDVAGQAGVRTQIPGEGAARAVGGLGKKLWANADTSIGSRVLLAEMVVDKVKTGPVFVGFGTAEQLAPVAAGLATDAVPGNVTFISVDDTKKGPVANDFKALHEEHEAAGTPLVLVYVGDGTKPALAVNASEFKSPDLLKALVAKLPQAAPAAAPAATPVPANQNPAPATNNVVPAVPAAPQAPAVPAGAPVRAPAVPRAPGL